MSESKNDDEKQSLRVRQEIHSLMNPDANDQEGIIRRTLFILALSKVLTTAPSDLYSFWRIAGIHGAPYEVYDGVRAPPEQVENEDWRGYCTHGSILFPTWHRAYMNLIEQALIRQAVAIAEGNKYSQEPRFLAEAKKLAFPYWDWGVKGGTIPQFFVDHEVQVVGWDLQVLEKPVPNPLAAYSVPVDLGDVNMVSNKYNPHARPHYIVPTGNDLIFTPKGFPTVRFPTAAYETDYEAWKTKYEAERDLVIEKLYHCLQTKTWRVFSNHSSIEAIQGDENFYAADPPRSAKELQDWLDKEKPQVYVYYASLESVHDKMHNYIGGDGGHMAFPELAGFDPIFFLHHCQVDRLAAIWQALHPNETMHDEKETQSGTRTILPGSTIGLNTPLTPFRTRIGDTGSGCYNSRMVWNIHDLGYTYPGLEDPRKLLNAYRPDVDPKLLTLWFVTVWPLQDLLGGKPYRLEVYLGLKKGDYNNKEERDKRKVGEVVAFSNSSKNKCTNCKKNAEARKRICSSLSLVDTLKRVFGKVDDLNGEEISNMLSYYIVVSGKAPREPYHPDDVIAIVNWSNPDLQPPSGGTRGALSAVTPHHGRAWVVQNPKKKT
eukprot:TRINITY_DN694_c0_g3_i1.p1 TRINITY_DN694_c0_g3~~TRINITY_DN694_c0_g3_i1.p1  ORF type:complete len:602 (-),score=154.35 TRINITY_DN694_c0_g3_i1:87-1892(-)